MSVGPTLHERWNINMADLLGAANRVPGYDNVNNNRTQMTPARSEQAQVQNVPDPNRVVRPDGRSEQQGANDALQANLKRYDSNLQTFLEQLRQTPQLIQTLNQTIVMLRGMISTPGLQAGIAQEMAQLLDMLRLDEQGFRKLFMEQVNGGNRFSGALFSLLRQACGQMSNQRGQEAILEFVRRYIDYSSAPHISKNLTSLLHQMGDYLPASWREQLGQLTTQLEQGLAGGAREDNLALLQQKIIPYLARYVERAHDLGPLRALLNLLVLNTARYQNAGEAEMLQAFRQMEGYSTLLAGLNQLDDGAILRLLQDSEFTRCADSPFTQGLAHAASQALKGEYGTGVRESFAEIVRAMLIQQSVYMPLNHMLFPIEWNGKMMYSELWVDPNAQDEEKKGEPGGKKVQFLFKLDLESLGFLEVSMAVRDGQVQMHIYGPEEVSSHQGIIASDMADILARHQLKGTDIQVSKLETPLALTQVFPDLFEGRQGVNVKI